MSQNLKVERKQDSSGGLAQRYTKWNLDIESGSLATPLIETVYFIICLKAFLCIDM